MNQDSSKRSAAIALALLLPVPALAVMAAMVFEPTRGTPLGQGLYTAGKIWICMLPALWWLLIDRRRWSISPMKHGGLGFGIGSGIVIFIAIVGAYFLFGDLIDVEQMREAAERNGIGTPLRYLLLVIPLAMINSLLEEYVWRWFIFRKFETLFGSTAAILASSFFFALHHLIALLAQSTWQVAVLGTIGVFLGGCIWCWGYQRYRSVWPCYISHIIADIAVFGVGWLILFR